MRTQARSKSLIASGFLPVALLALIAGAPSAFAQPAKVWEHRLNGPDSSVDLAWASAMDSLGNLLVAGSSPARDGQEALIALKYSPRGQLLWERRLDASGDITFDRALTIAPDMDDNVYVGGLLDDAATDFDGVVARYSPDGELAWSVQLDIFSAAIGLPLDDTVNKVLPAPTGGVYAVGTAHNGPFGHDTAIFAVKLSASGAIEWTRTFEHIPSTPGQHNAPDVAQDASLDAEGNLIIAGTTGTQLDVEDGIRPQLLKYSPTGELLWSIREDQDVNGIVTRVALRTDAAGGLYLAYARGTDTNNFQTSLASYTSQGVRLWRTSITSNLAVRPIQIHSDPARDRVVVLAHAFGFDFPVNEDVVLSAFSLSGQSRWQRTYNGPAAQSSDVPAGMAVDGQGGVHLVASAGNGPSFNYTDIDYLLRRHEILDGSQTWSAFYGTPAHAYRAKGIQYDPNRNRLLIAGESAPDPLSADAPSFDITATSFRLGVECVADLDNGTGTGTPDGAVTIDDLLHYLVAFELGSDEADVDDGTSTGATDTAVTIDDLLHFLIRFGAGC